MTKDLSRTNRQTDKKKTKEKNNIPDEDKDIEASNAIFQTKHTKLKDFVTKTRSKTICCRKNINRRVTESNFPNTIPKKQKITTIHQSKIPQYNMSPLSTRS